MTDHERPDLADLEADHAAKQRRLNETITVNSAENTVATARMADLAAEIAAASRREAAARGQLTKAQKDGDADMIAAARLRVEQRSAEYENTFRAAMDEMSALLSAMHNRTGDVFEAMKPAWDAGTAVIEELGRRRDDLGRHDDPGTP